MLGFLQVLYSVLLLPSYNILDDVGFQERNVVKINKFYGLYCIILVMLPTYLIL